MWYLLMLFSVTQINALGILYPKESETREVKSLDGLWNFAILNDTNFDFYKNDWWKGDLNLITKNEIHLMPVPSSYNDIVTDSKIRDYVGWVGYDRSFFVPKEWNDGRKIFIRLDSVNYAAQVFINGEDAVTHEIGHLPFEADISSLLHFGQENQITVLCDNTLSSDSIPQGGTYTDSVGRKLATYTFDFFNYAGIHRSVRLYTTPSVYIQDVKISTSLNDKTATVTYEIYVEGSEEVECHVTILNKDDDAVATNVGNTGDIVIESPNLWWPYLMHDNPGYLYKAQVELYDADGELIDKYVQRFGIRTISWTNTSLLLNNKPIYLRGFGRHEDSDFRGRGFDLPLIIRDHNLIKWMGANSYRTSHYPYAEEIMDLADEIGIMIINECPAVNMDGFSSLQLENHKRSLTELYRRDKNRPSTIMWSIANEPRSQHTESQAYFEHVASHIKSFDLSRPISVAEMYTPDEDHSSYYVDIISLNRYNAWYSDVADLDIIQSKLIAEVEKWHNKFGKPVLVSEYGADTLEGFHTQPSYIWSEEFQLNYLSNHFKAFDELREKSGYFIGEFIWNFADFKTIQEIRRVGGNKKGIFTRNRQPKASAHMLRRRYWALAKLTNPNITIPEDVNDYIISNGSIHDEL
ncbi:beta-glucuronidase [Aethina tumida]|uniref:beta-glucuronidase n=1 Tax=Aethina tumida TaxID=116153 RepID=UPI00096B2DBE|nr:beta-glucuronidase [Aethina tumida]